tara:strand:+ start:818 stop:1417 length:600 start_codon:yes stop_codon:yes gene_type:complete
MSSLASQSGNVWGYRPGTSAGLAYDQGLTDMTTWVKANPNNKSLGTEYSGHMMDNNRMLMNMGLGSQWQRMQLGNWAEYHGGMENLKTGNTMKIMAAEGGIAKELMGKQGEEGRRQIKTQGDQDRRSLRVTGQEQRLGQQELGSQTRMNYRSKGLQDRLLTRETGSENRKTQRDKYNEERKMRADARGAIQRSGAKFYG